ncbi:MAG: hypothetical protein JXK94_05460 [Deltaproteobacteria bacterium]|nr:hypothetical protein [Deltaproteobacteria bacterium]
MALDEPKNDEKVYTINEINLLIDDSVLPFTRENEIDFRMDSYGQGFSISPPAGSNC